MPRCGKHQRPTSTAKPACSTGGTSTNSCRTRSMPAGSPIKAKSTKASIRRSSIRIFGIGFSKGAAGGQVVRRSGKPDEPDLGGKSERSIRMTLSLAFMSPALAIAAMAGRLPRGFCIKRLTDLPMLWSEQWRAVGLQLRLQWRNHLGGVPASRSRGPGNGILWAETGGRFQPQNAGERPEFGSQTATRLTNRPELRGFLPARKPRRFARTAWWDVGIELMAIAAWHPFKTRRRVADLVRETICRSECQSRSRANRRR